MKSALVIRHVAFEDLGAFAPALAAAGYEIRYCDAADGIDDLVGSATDWDLLVVLGGPIGAYEERVYPFLVSELRLIEAQIAAGRRTLGICLGAQLIARSLGARVYPGPVKEIGWAPVRLSAAGQTSCLRHLDGGVPVLHWHGDTFDLPPGAVRLASSAAYENQAFSRGPGTLAMQFHVEATAPRLEHWFVGHAAEIAAVPGLDVASLRRDSRDRAGQTAAIAGEILAEWLRD
ncbi:MAG: glutamine amidotransferase [Rhodospirillales bacterium]|nr:glutamine amidotransferase [Rhodospirillales bacterium]